MLNTIEYRAYLDLTDVAPMVDSGSDDRTIFGRVIAYNSMSKPLRTMNGDMFNEVILPRSLDDSLSEEGNDVLALMEHDGSKLLGRLSNKTLALENREDGLYAKIKVPNTSYGKDLVELAERGDLKGFSFGFTNPVSRNYKKDGMNVREISKMNLREISVVSSPAYNDTALALRSEDFAEQQLGKSDKELQTEFKFRFYSTTHR